MNDDPTHSRSNQHEIDAASEAFRKRRATAHQKKMAECEKQKIALLAGSGVAMGVGLLVLNRLGLFDPVDFAHRNMNRHSFWAAGHRLAALPREVGENLGLVHRRPRTFRHRLEALLDSAAGSLGSAGHSVGQASSDAYDAVREGLYDTGVHSVKIAKEHPAATVGAGLVALGLLAAAFIAPNYLDPSR